MAMNNALVTAAVIAGLALAIPASYLSAQFFDIQRTGGKNLRRLGPYVATFCVIVLASTVISDVYYRYFYETSLKLHLNDNRDQFIFHIIVPSIPISLCILYIYYVNRKILHSKQIGATHISIENKHTSFTKSKMNFKDFSVLKLCDFYITTILIFQFLDFLDFSLR